MGNRCLSTNFTAVQSQEAARLPFPWAPASRDGGGLGNVSQSFMDPVWGGGKSICLFKHQFSSELALPSCSFSPMFFWDRSPLAAWQTLAPGASPENQVHLGSKSTPWKAGGVGSRMVPWPGTGERLMEPPEGCYKRGGSRAYPPLGTAAVGAGGGWDKEGFSQPPQGGEHPV